MNSVLGGRQAASILLGGECLRLAAPPGDLLANGLAGTVVAQVGLLCAPTGVVKGNALYGALAVLNLGTATMHTITVFLAI